MKYIIIGLGYFGSSLAVKLTAMGHEVIAVDSDIAKVTQHKDRITHTVCLDATDQQALATLPLSDTDMVLVGIGEDFGASVMAVANFKQLGVKKLIGRAISPLHQTVLEAIGVDKIIRPETESAERLAKSLDLKDILDSLDLTEDYNIIQATVPVRYVGKTIQEANFRQKYNINVLTIIRPKDSTNLFGRTQRKPAAIGVVAADTVFQADDIMVLFGKMEDIRKVLH
ncbi:potassium channel family protein [Hymenobacter arizonensis]|uniref:Trk system potassium uptake protein TrkA n=1 Tax=Hymenobacter arizonensis TaxID=1227077 RepID=A0A1I5WID5_HYMAR|nr:TrkA family potassium uptake protein [Hymenobacter arizonensis]SFQ19593.1 trk system potassium uptake protein TrkA [Hymenobacter arizonensis]